MKASSMHEAFKAPKGRPYRKYGSRALIITGVGIVQLLVIAAIYYSYQHPNAARELFHFSLASNPSTIQQSSILSHTASHQQLLTRRASLLLQVEEWNQLAAAARPLVKKDTSGSSSSGSSSAATSGLPVLEPILVSSASVNSGSSGSSSGSIASSSSSSSSSLQAGAAGVALVNNDRLGTYKPDPNTLMMSTAEAEQKFPVMASLLKAHSNDKREIMLALANSVMICQNVTKCWWDGGNILESFLTVLSHSNITNHLIGVMDDETARYLEGRKGVNWFKPDVEIPASLANTREANRVSTIKYTLLQQAIQLGYHTLVTDMDLVYVQNPFDHLYRDADIEASSDGYDATAYGVFGSIQDATMGWGGGGLFIKTFTINVGCAYVRATQRAFSLVKRVADSLAKSAAWDQQVRLEMAHALFYQGSNRLAVINTMLSMFDKAAKLVKVFNQELLVLSHGDYASPYASTRIMHHQQFVNSKTFFRASRAMYIPGKTSHAPLPVLVHFNYHPDKHKRMLCVMDRYFNGILDACDNFTGGSDPGT